MASLESTGHGNYVELRALDEDRQPGSLDYYTVTMLTMILLYASLTGFWSIRGDIEQMTGNRTLCAPVRKYEFLTGKVLGCIGVTFLQALVVLLFSGLVLKAYWGEDLVTVCILLMSQSIMAVSLGAGLAYLFKNGDAASGIINTAVPLIVFLGGGYVPLDVMGASFEKLSNISPVKWINSALFRVIYDGDYSQVALSLGINISIAVLFILIAAMFSRKGTGKYA
jgi:ABC-2 type transport system permease protein